jgi:hypothetical protein
MEASRTCWEVLIASGERGAPPAASKSFFQVS